MSDVYGVREVRSITLTGAQQVVTAALARAEELECRVSVVVLDIGGQVSALARMDGVAATVTTVAQNKANTALTLRTATDVFAEAIKANPMLVHSLSAQPGIALMAGGLPLTAGDDVIGAVGVSGARDGKDLLVARAGAEALLGC
ncbi:GlcG/HbpS family heme-binding protein [Streptomyces noursei]|uniref:GlcG/HbpS family heme-binding protein n=1 Tax=Streptomyces noursei TaxID=1971 RepID=UPI001679CC26|nr:heme-binding protein [Streptomyces noursei]MCZ1018721.1 heme-binding protein [Streptomyces noursei]GGX26821.1 PduO protein [Streptomyces noursei]